ncbi:MAG TPA: hypothetical protein VI968_02625 [archaeon]|nr:hypothetical protein [archaeon]
MNYVEIRRTIKGQPQVIKVTYEPRGWNKSYEALQMQTPVGMHDIWSAESHDNFNNSFAKVMQAIYDQKSWFGLITRDVVVGSGVQRNERGLRITYITRADTDLEVVHTDLIIPKNGWYVPTNDGFFVEDTGVPFETVRHKKDAERRWRTKGFNPDYVSKLCGPDFLEKNEKRIVGRDFTPDVEGHVGQGRFLVVLDGLSSGPGLAGVASLPPYEDKAEFVVRI